MHTDRESAYKSRILPRGALRAHIIDVRSQVLLPIVQQGCPPDMARVAYLVALASALAPNRWDAPPHTSRELQRALGDCPTADTACALLQERAHDGNEVNVAATLVRAAREGASRDTLRYLYDACRASAGRMAPQRSRTSSR